MSNYRKCARIPPGGGDKNGEWHNGGLIVKE